MNNKHELSSQESEELLNSLKHRFEQNMKRHKDLHWSKLEQKLSASPEKLLSLFKMEESGGEPDVIDHDTDTDEYLFFDCSSESPKGRRSVCYDKAALEARKKFKPKHSACEMAKEMGIQLLTESEYRKLQELGDFDTITSSWIATPSEIRDLGGALFGDFRFNTVFIYHNGAESYYAARGFRGSLKV